MLPPGVWRSTLLVQGCSAQKRESSRALLWCAAAQSIGNTNERAVRTVQDIANKCQQCLVLIAVSVLCDSS
jgi:hypothetical protein